MPLTYRGQCCPSCSSNDFASELRKAQELQSLGGRASGISLFCRGPGFFCWIPLCWSFPSSWNGCPKKGPEQACLCLFSCPVEDTWVSGSQKLQIEFVFLLRLNGPGLLGFCFPTWISFSFTCLKYPEPPLSPTPRPHPQCEAITKCSWWLQDLSWQHLTILKIL